MKSLIMLSMLFASSLAFARSGTTSGRFQIVQLSDMRRDQLMIDSETGKLWRYTCVKQGESECDLAVWTPEIIENITATRKQIQQIANPPEPKPSADSSDHVGLSVTDVMRKQDEAQKRAHMFDAK